MVTITIWIRKSDLQNFILFTKSTDDIEDLEYIEKKVKQYPINIFTEKMMGDFLQINVSFDLFVKLNLK